MKFRYVPVLAVTSLVAFGHIPAFAQNDPVITIEGSGWGHGVGMSQYGAYGRALSVEDGGGGQGGKGGGAEGGAREGGGDRR